MASARRSGIWTVVAVVVVVAVAVAVGLVVRANDPARGPRVLVVGDSVTFMSRSALDGAFDWTDNFDAQGRPGYRTDQLVPVALRKIDEDQPDTLVLLTGYNDLTQGIDTTAAVDQLMGIAGDVPCAVWVLLPTKGEFDQAAAEAFDQRIVALAEDQPTVHLATDWRDVVDAGPGPDPDPRLVSEDHIHPTEEGIARLARVMEEAVTRECR
ncbi:MAG: SGNH/GDSL hydrolase family protein [Iamia sp.]